MNDPELLRAYLDDGSEPAFAALANRYTGLVYSAALRQLGGNSHLARDVVQSVFTDLARKADRLRHRTVLTGWLYTSTHFAVAEVLRSEFRRRTREQEAHTMMQISSSDTPDTWSHLRPVLDEVMRELGDEDRDSILLRFFEGRPFAEIGDKFALSENAARMRVERALDRMHALLSKRGLTSSAAALATVLAEQAVGAAPPGLAAEVASAAFARALPAAKPVLHFLASAKAQLTTVAAVIAVCAGTLAILTQANHRVRRAVDELQRDNRAAASSLRDHRELLDRRTATLAARRQFATVVQRLPASSADATLTPTDRRLMLRTRTSLATFYAGLFGELKLGAEKQERLEQLLLQKTIDEIAVLHGMASGSDRGAGAIDLDTINALKAAVAVDRDGEIHALLGDDLFARYVAYAGTLAIRRQVDEIAAALKSTDAALSDDQIAGLITFVARGSADYSRPLPASLLAQAGTSLDPTQQAALNRLQALRVARNTILETNRAAAAKGLVTLLPPSGLELDSL